MAYKVQIPGEPPQKSDSQGSSHTQKLLETPETTGNKLADPRCWNCQAPMTETRDISGREWWTCHACEVSTDRLKPVTDLPRAWVVEEVRDQAGALRAFMVCSAVLDDHLWVVIDRNFEPRDALAVYYADEIPVLATKSPEQLREVHKVKLAFPGCRVIQ